MNFPKKTLLGSLLLLGASNVFAIDTADLTVIGTIVPAACTPTFAGGGVVDYGVIPSASLSSTAYTKLATRPVAYSITCDAPIAIGMSFTDSRTSDIGAEVPSAATFGLGKQGTTNIGNYVMKYDMATATGDGASVDMIQSTSGGPWVASTEASTIQRDIRVYAFAATGAVVPGVYTTVAGTINVTAEIVPVSTLDMTGAVTLDGLSTMSVRYL